MNLHLQEQRKAHTREIANRLCGPYRPPRCRLVMLPMVVLRRLGCVPGPSKEAVLWQDARLNILDMSANAMNKLFG